MGCVSGKPAPSPDRARRRSLPMTPRRVVPSPAVGSVVSASSTPPHPSVPRSRPGSGRVTPHGVRRTRRAGLSPSPSPSVDTPRSAASGMPPRTSSPALGSGGRSDSGHGGSAGDGSTVPGVSPRVDLHMDDSLLMPASPGASVLQDRFRRSQTTGATVSRRRGSPASRPGSGFRWRKGETIGKGAYGAVHLGLNDDTGELMAVKEIHFSLSDKKEISALQSEINLMRSLVHTHIVRYLGTEVKDNTLYIFTEWVSGGSLEKMLSRFHRLAEKVVAKYTRQLLVGLDFLHSHSVVHRDIKGANILVDDRGVIKLADFGASKKLPPLSDQAADAVPPTTQRALTSINRSLRGTPYFMAPEVIQQVSHTFKADIWSVGGTVLQMATGLPPWKTLGLESVSALMFHIVKTREPPPMPEYLSPTLREFLLLCFDRNPDTRPTAAELLQHPFLKEPSPVAAASGGSSRRRMVGSRSLVSIAAPLTPSGIMPSIMSPSGGAGAGNAQRRPFNFGTTPRASSKPAPLPTTTTLGVGAAGLSPPGALPSPTTQAGGGGGGGGGAGGGAGSGRLVALLSGPPKRTPPTHPPHSRLGPGVTPLDVRAASPKSDNEARPAAVTPTRGSPSPPTRGARTKAGSSPRVKRRGKSLRAIVTTPPAMSAQAFFSGGVASGDTSSDGSARRGSGHTTSVAGTQSSPGSPAVFGGASTPTSAIQPHGGSASASALDSPQGQAMTAASSLASLVTGVAVPPPGPPIDATDAAVSPTMDTRAFMQELADLYPADGMGGDGVGPGGPAGGSTSAGVPQPAGGAPGGVVEVSQPASGYSAVRVYPVPRGGSGGGGGGGGGGLASRVITATSADSASPGMRRSSTTDSSEHRDLFPVDDNLDGERLVGGAMTTLRGVPGAQPSPRRFGMFQISASEESSHGFSTSSRSAATWAPSQASERSLALGSPQFSPAAGALTSPSAALVAAAANTLQHQQQQQQQQQQQHPRKFTFGRSSSSPHGGSAGSPTTPRHPWALTPHAAPSGRGAAAQGSDRSVATTSEHSTNTGYSTGHATTTTGSSGSAAVFHEVAAGGDGVEATVLGRPPKPRSAGGGRTGASGSGGSMGGGGGDSGEHGAAVGAGTGAAGDGLDPDQAVDGIMAAATTGFDLPPRYHADGEAEAVAVGLPPLPTPPSAGSEWLPRHSSTHTTATATTVLRHLDSKDRGFSGLGSGSVSPGRAPSRPASSLLE